MLLLAPPAGPDGSPVLLIQPTEKKRWGKKHQQLAAIRQVLNKPLG